MNSINGKTLYGADVLSMINKAIDNNETSKIEKDENGLYIANDENSIKIELTLLSTDENGETKEVKCQMEALEKARIK